MQDLLRATLKQSEARVLQSSQGNSMVLCIEDVHAAPGLLSTAAPILELVRELIDTSAFMTADGKPCIVKDLSLFVSAWGPQLKAAPPAQRMRSKMAVLHLTAPKHQHALRSAGSAGGLDALCQAFGRSVAHVLGNADASAFGAQASTLLALLLKDVAEEGQQACWRFDLQAVRRVLLRVQADVLYDPLDFVSEATKRRAMSSSLHGTALLNVLGKLAEEKSWESSSSESRNASDKQPAASSLVTHVHVASRRIRPEHLWLLLASEAVKEMSSCLPGDATERLRHRLVDLVDTQLSLLLSQYTAQEAEKQRQAEQHQESLWLASPAGNAPAASQSKHAPGQMSELLRTLSQAGMRKLAHVAVMHGAISHVEDGQIAQRVVLPLHLEVFQALLLQLLQRVASSSPVRICLIYFLACYSAPCQLLSWLRSRVLVRVVCSSWPRLRQFWVSSHV
jgi:hypothetical protein